MSAAFAQETAPPVPLRLKVDKCSLTFAEGSLTFCGRFPDICGMLPDILLNVL
jgi:hypothetical protein